MKKRRKLIIELHSFVQEIALSLIFLAMICSAISAYKNENISNHFIIVLFLIISIIEIVYTYFYVIKYGSLVMHLVLILFFLAWEFIITLILSKEHISLVLYQGFTWPLVYIGFFLYSRKYNITTSMKLISLIGTIILCVVLPYNIHRHLIDYGKNGTVISPLYNCIGIAAIFMVYFGESKISFVVRCIFILFLFVSTKRAGIIAISSGMMCYIVTKYYIKGKEKVNIIRLVLRLVLGIIAAFIVIYYSAFYFNPNLLRRLLVLGTEGETGRSTLWRKILDNFVNQNTLHKVIGNGFEAVTYNITTKGYLAHNSYLEILYDFGILGFLFLLGFIIYIAIITFKCIKEKNALAPILTYLLICAMTLSMLSFFFEQSVLSILPFAVAYGICLGLFSRNH